MTTKNVISVLGFALATALGVLAIPAQAQQPTSRNLRRTGSVTLPGNNERAVNVVRLKMDSNHSVRLVAEGADVPPVEFSGTWSGPTQKAFSLKLTRALKGVKSVASGRIYMRGTKDVQRIAINGKAEGQDFSLEFLPARPPVLAFKQLSLTANGSGFIRMPDNTRSALNQVALTLEKNGNATIQINGATETTFGGKWSHVGNSELIRLTITSGFNNAGGTGKGTITMRSETELENLYFTSKAAEGVVYAVRFTGAQGAPPAGTAAAPKPSQPSLATVKPVPDKGNATPAEQVTPPEQTPPTSP